ncbi:MAG: phosphatase PAP2 family protein [Candidatus Kapabacteria bacterium]|nr:phosphatase PAP2 family protein [Candidatus Kapabacteria bacterium]
MLRIILAIITCAALSASAQDCTDLPWEANLTYQANTIQSVAVRDMSIVASDALLPLSIGVPVGMYLYGIIGTDASHPNAKRYSAESGLQTFVTMGVTYGAVILLKNIFDRPRPYQAYPDCITNYRNDADGSMPSGHSAGSAALATSLILRYPEWYVIAPSVAYALYTGFSRLNLGMHYLSDVLVGYAIGVGIALGVNALNNELFDLADPILPSGESSQSMLLNFTPTQSIPIFSMSIPL